MTAKKRKRGPASDPDTGAGENGDKTPRGTHRIGTTEWRDDIRNLRYIRRQCELLRSRAENTPDHVDAFVERVFRAAGVED